MKLLSTFAAVGVVALLATPAAAETYFGVGYGQKSMDFAVVAPGASNVNLSEVNLRLGWKSQSWFGVEGDLSVGMGEAQVSPYPFKVKLDTSAFLYGVATVPVGEKASLLARAGYGHLVTKLGSGGGTTNDGATTYGVGAQYKINDKAALRADYTMYDVSNVDTKGWTLSYLWSF